MKKIIILGSTGSIGTQTIDVISQHADKFSCVGISAHTSVDKVIEQVEQLNIKNVCFSDEKSAVIFQKQYAKPINLYIGIEGMCDMVREIEADMVITSVVGMIGLKPTMEAIKAGKHIGLANKETLVTGGKLVMEAAKEKNVKIIPVDSEHSAIFQALNGENPKEVEKIILTASGGPFRGKKFQELENIRVAQALKHPNWSMGRKISIDSATMMNKGLEVIEAKWLFDLEFEKIDVLVHPQSIVHSMVEYVDGSTIAHLGISDMRIPIQYALTYPNRLGNNLPKLNLAEIGSLTFERIDQEAFKCFDLAMKALKMGQSHTCVLNAANEVAVALFLEEKIGFNDIYRMIEGALSKHQAMAFNTVEEIIALDENIRREILKNNRIE